MGLQQANLRFAFGVALLSFAWGTVADDMLRLQSGKPDLSGNYDISNLTPWTRPQEVGDRAFLTPEEAQKIAARQAATVDATNANKDTDRDAPEKGGNVGA